MAAHEDMLHILDTHYLRERASGDVKSAYINFDGDNRTDILIATFEDIAERATRAAKHLRKTRRK